MEHDHDRCRGCGGRLSPQDQVVEVSCGHILGESEGLTDFDHEQVWGYMHQHCFLVAVGDPSAIFAVTAVTASPIS